MVNKKELIDFFYSIPFYKTKIDKANLTVQDLYLDFSLIPSTTKEELRKTHPYCRMSCDNKNLSHIFSSSGTTGTPTVYPWTQEDIKVLSLISKRTMELIGISDNDLALILAPFGLPVMWFCMMTQYASVNSGVIPLGISEPDNILDIINEFQPTIYTSIPVSALRLFEYKLKYYNKFFRHGFKQFHFGGDYLSDARRKRIENVWEVQCFDFYGLSEIMGPIAGECQEKNGLHFSSDYVSVEIIDPITMQEVNENEIGVAVYTTLWKKGSPLLRYWSDDFISISNSKCSCGSCLPKITYKGRVRDSFVIEDQRYFAKDIENLLMNNDWVGNEWQILIENHESKIHIKIQFESNFDNSCKRRNLEEELTNFFSNKPSLELEVVSPGFFSRSDLKPERIKDLRK